MLPEVLSNGLCSLNPKVDRLCMVCDMRIDSSGKVTKSTFVEAVMRSSARLTYEQVSAFLTGESTKDVPKPLHGAIRNLHGLYKAFAKARHRRGAIELDLPSTKFELGKSGRSLSWASPAKSSASRPSNVTMRIDSLRSA
jgi:ribonuclease R